MDSKRPVPNESLDYGFQQQNNPRPQPPVNNSSYNQSRNTSAYDQRQPASYNSPMIYNQNWNDQQEEPMATDSRNVMPRNPPYQGQQLYQNPPRQQAGSSPMSRPRGPSQQHFTSQSRNPPHAPGKSQNYRQTTLTQSGQLKQPQMMPMPRPNREPNFNIRAQGQNAGTRAPPARPPPPLGQRGGQYQPRGQARAAPTGAVFQPRNHSGFTGQRQQIRHAANTMNDQLFADSGPPTRPPQQQQGSRQYSGSGYSAPGGNRPASNYQSGRNNYQNFNQPNNPAPMRSRFPNPASFGQHPRSERPQFQSPPVGNTPYGQASMPYMPSLDDGMSGSTSGQPKDEIVKPKPDTSMKMATGTVQHLKQNDHLMGKGTLTWEVIAMVNSAVSCPQGGSRKEFILKDEDASIPCVFYEIDREMPRVIRGQWYRCVGSSESGDGGRIFKCVSIRRATDEEKRCHRALVAMCDMTLRAWRAKAKEL